MDYASIHGPGISNFSSSSPHRLPSISAAQALRDLSSSPTRCISTGLKDLDSVLQNRLPSTIVEGEVFHGGVPRGRVTEFYGPSGVGKTSLGMQLAASALHAGEGVIWVDGSHPLPGPRFSQILNSFQPLVANNPSTSSSPPQQRNVSDLEDKLTHFTTPTLAHLIALLCNQTSSHPDPKTSLIIVDSFSTLITSAYPRTTDSSSTPRKPGAPNPSARKFSVLQFLITSLQKLAATRNLAIVLFSQCVTKMRLGAGAALVPAINTTAWEQGLGCRVVLFRDWGWMDEEGKSVEDVRLAEVVKAEGIGVTNGHGMLAGFYIDETGLHPLVLPVLSTQHRSPQHPTFQQQQVQNQIQHESPTLPLPQKRKLSATNFEIPDSDAEDDEDYGWAEEDEEDVPAMPPQWQGSEDILIPDPEELEAEAEEEDGDDAPGEEMEGAGKVKRIQKEEIGDSEDELAL